jgi:hypothetical protein
LQLLVFSLQDAHICVSPTQERRERLFRELTYLFAMSQTDAIPSPPIITLTIRWLPVAQNESPQQQKVILGITLADQEGTTTAPLMQMTTAAELGELPSPLLVQLVEKAAGILPVQLARLQNQNSKAFMSSTKAAKANSLSTAKAAPTAQTLSSNNGATADSTQQLNLFQS